MPLRSVRMKRLTFGFHRRVWCPKCTPLSSSWRMVTTAMAVLLFSTHGCVACGCVSPDRVAGEPGARLTPADRVVLWKTDGSGCRTFEDLGSSGVLWARGFISTSEMCSQCIRWPLLPRRLGRQQSADQRVLGQADSSARDTDRMMFDRPIPARAALVALLVALLAALAPAGPPARADDSGALTDLGWVWPLDRMRIVAPFVAPAHEYGPGHRGIDI